LKTFPITDFSGGWNPRDAWSQVADNESPDMLNVTLDERGGVVKRLGLTKTGAQIANTANVQSIFYSISIDRLLVQVSDKVYSSSDGGATWSASIKTFSTSARCHMVDFVGKVVLIHPVDKVFTYDGTTFSGVVANSPLGSCMAVWQNAIWSIGDPTSASTKVRVTRSDLGAITWPASPVTVDIRSKDDEPLTCVGGGTGMDDIGRGGLLVWKEGSYYRINDSATGAYTVENYDYGASGPMCVTTNQGVTASICRKGIIATDGSGQAGTVVSDKIEPLFHPVQLTYANASTMVAGSFQDRMVFSLPFDGSTTNSLTLEFSPAQGWFAPHNFGITSATAYKKNTNKLYGGKVGTDSSSYGYVLDVFTGGSDDTVAITARHEIRWFEPNRGNACRFRRLNVNGRGTFNLYFKINYDSGQGELFPISIVGDGAVWGTAKWGVDTWSSTLFQDYERLFSLGYGRSFSIEISESSTTSGTGPSLLDTGAAEARGAFAVYGYNLDIQSLGNN
jgi:hypothetical protein